MFNKYTHKLNSNCFQNPPKQGYTVPDSTTEPNSIASDVPDSAAAAHATSATPPSTARPLTTGSVALSKHATVSTATAHHLPNGHQHNNGHHLSGRYASAAANGPEPRHSVSSTNSAGSSSTTAKHNAASVAYAPQLFDAALSRRSPDGTDNDAYLLAEEQLKPTSAHNGGNNNHINNNNNTSATASVGKMGNDNISAEIFSTSNDNGKINVQVTVLVGESVFCLYRFYGLRFCPVFGSLRLRLVVCGFDQNPFPSQICLLSEYNLDS